MTVVPTGGGKTVIFCDVAKKLKLKTLVVAHTRELIDQCKRTAETWACDYIDAFSIQKTSRNFELLDDYDFLIVDECHRSGADSYQKVVEEFIKKGRCVLGVTATPFRHDTFKLNTLFGPTVCTMNLIEMIENGFLCDFEGYRIKTNVTLTGVSTKNGDFISAKLSPVVNVKNRNELIVREYKKIAPKEKSLCFAVSVAHANELAKEFLSQGVSAGSVSGDVSDKERRQTIKDFKEGRLRVLVNCQLLTEGFDDPSISCLLMARPTCSKILYTQMIGRGSRLFEGKSVCKVIEFTDNYYDICQIEHLVSSTPSVHTIKQGERVSGFGRRHAELLKNDSTATICEKMDVLRKLSHEKPATSWQIKYLRRLGIETKKDISEIEANVLITEAIDGLY